MYCRYCGTDIEDDDAFCYHCGKRTAEQPQKTEQVSQTGRNYSFDTVDIKDVADEAEQQLIGKNSEYYIPKFANIRCFGKKVQWNWAAWLCGPFWLLYRKMYKWTAGLLAINIVFIEQGMGLLSSIVHGLLGNLIYSNHIHNLANKARCIPEGVERDKFIHSKGGTSWFGVIVLFVMMTVFIVLLLCLIWAFAYNTGNDFLY